MGDAWVGVVGAAIGGIVGIVGTVLAQYLASRQEKRTRFVADRRHVYSRLLAACDEANRELIYEANSPSVDDPSASYVQAQALRIAEAKRCLSEINFTASKAVSGSAAEMVRLLVLVERTTSHLPHAVFYKGGVPSDDPDEDRWRQEWSAFHEARMTFIHSARQELGVDE
jgi:hypothetical protein